MPQLAYHAHMKSLSEALRQATQGWQRPAKTLRNHLTGATKLARARLRQAINSARAAIERPGHLAQAPQTTWMTLARPSLMPSNTPLRRVAEPIVALIAASVLIAASALAVMSLAGFVFACLLAVAILTQIFGLSLDVDLPA